MNAKSRAWQSGSGSWKACEKSTKLPMSVLPVCTAASKKRRSSCARSKNWRPIMIQLKSDCLIFQTNDGEQVPCSAEWVTFELLGQGSELVDPEIVRHASAAVLHYFKHELQRQSVSVGEFALALEKVLRSFGLSVHADCQTQPPAPHGGGTPLPLCQSTPKVLESNLMDLA